jgi:hypothetical protein
MLYSYPPDARLLGAAVFTMGMIASVLLGQPSPSTFDCVLSFGQNCCKVCSGCTVQPNGQGVTCGTIEAAACCDGNEFPHCWVETGPNGSTYHAECEQQS